VGDSTTYIFIALAVVVVIYFFFSSRRRRKAAEDLKSTMVPGARVMTSFGLFGTIVSLDDTANEAELEVSPGVIVTVHRQTLSKVVTAGPEGAAGEPRSVEEAMEIANREAAEREAAAAAEPELNADHAIPAEPQFGERVEAADESAPKKPRRAPAKKTTES
jgi:preprotein translocase subunit YajC